MKKIVVSIGLILIVYISIGHCAPLDPYILEYRIDKEFDNQLRQELLTVKGKNFSFNIQPLPPDSWKAKIDFEEKLADKINIGFYSNLDSKGHILEAWARLMIEKKRFILSTELAHLNQTPLMKESLLGKVSFIFPPSSIFGFINYTGKINIGWLHLPSLYSRYSYGREGIDMVGVGTKWYFYTEPYEITPNLIFKSKLKISPHLFSDLPKRNYNYDEEIMGAFSDFPVDYSLNFTQKVTPKCHIEMDYQGNINPVFYPWWGGKQILLGHGVVSKVSLKLTEVLFFQLAAYLPISNKKISYFNSNASVMSKEILGSLEWKRGNSWHFKGLLDYNYENNQFEEVTFSASRRLNSLEGGMYYTSKREYHTLGIYLSTHKKAPYSPYDIKRYQEFPQEVFSQPQKEDMKWLKNKGFEETVAVLNTPEKVASYLGQFFQYHSEDRIIPQTPQETFEKKMGDCDDQARFASWVLTQHGYESYVLTYRGRRVAHGICIYKTYNGKWNAIEYDEIFYVQADNPEELITKIDGGALKFFLFKPDDNYPLKSHTASQTLEKIINWFWAD